MAEERFPRVEAALAILDQDIDRRVALVRLAAKLNNGTEHFDHGPSGYSYLCLKCAQEDGMGPFFTTIEALNQDLKAQAEQANETYSVTVAAMPEAFRDNADIRNTAWLAAHLRPEEQGEI